MRVLESPEILILEEVHEGVEFNGFEQGYGSDSGNNEIPAQYTNTFVSMFDSLPAKIGGKSVRDVV